MTLPVFSAGTIKHVRFASRETPKFTVLLVVPSSLLLVPLRIRIVGLSFFETFITHEMHIVAQVMQPLFYLLLTSTD